MDYHWLNGDTHSRNEDRLNSIKFKYKFKKPEEVGIIILGDAGFNFYLDNSERNRKKRLGDYNFYCVRGNHEERPENLGYEIVYDKNVQGNVYVDADNRNIKYFLDGGEYNIGGYSVLTIGGAYSVDKYYRLKRAALANQKFTGWFPDEQLTQDEMTAISKTAKGKHYDFILSHTCPYDWQPTDLFLSSVDQTTVDNSMEKWLMELKKEVSYDVWCVGHYHDDRYLPENGVMFYWEFNTINEIYKDIIKRKKEELSVFA